MAPVSPSWAKTAPAVPAAADASKGASNCQHSSVDSFWALVAMVVTFKVLGGGAVAANVIFASRKMQSCRQRNGIRRMLQGSFEDKLSR